MGEPLIIKGYGWHKHHLRLHKMKGTGGVDLPKKVMVLGVKIPRTVFSYLFYYNLLIILILLTTTFGIRFFLRPRVIPTIVGWKESLNEEELLWSWEMDIRTARDLLLQGIPILKIRRNAESPYPQSGLPRK